MTVQIVKADERVNWARIDDKTLIYYRKSDDRRCAQVTTIFNSTDWRANVDCGSSDKVGCLGDYRTQLAAQRAVEQYIDKE